MAVRIVVSKLTVNCDKVKPFGRRWCIFKKSPGLGPGLFLYR